MDVTLQNFVSEVVEGSKAQLVLVDFWAPWCAPCRALTPVLEKLEAAYAGKFKLVKINTEENPELAANFQVRSIPFVVAFYQGRPVNAFNGALPEAKIREFIDQLLPNPLSEWFEQVNHALSQQHFVEAERILKQILGHDALPVDQEDETRVLLIDVLMQLERFEEASQQVGLLAEGVRLLPEVAARIETIEAQRNALANDPVLQQLLEQVTHHPADLSLRLKYASELRTHQQYEQALEQLLFVIKTDRQFQEDAARKMMLEVFNEAAEFAPLVSKYRRQLSMILLV